MRCSGFSSPAAGCLATGKIRETIIALALWLTACISLPFLSDGAALFPSFVAVLDIALVFVIFKGDVRIT